MKNKRIETGNTFVLYLIFLFRISVIYVLLVILLFILIIQKKMSFPIIGYHLLSLYNKAKILGKKTFDWFILMLQKTKFLIQSKKIYMNSMFLFFQILFYCLV